MKVALIILNTSLILSVLSSSDSGEEKLNFYFNPQLRYIKHPAITNPMFHYYPTYYYLPQFVDDKFTPGILNSPITDQKLQGKSRFPTLAPAVYDGQELIEDDEKIELDKLQILKEKSTENLGELTGIVPSIEDNVGYYPRILLKGSLLSLFNSFSFSTYTKTKTYLIPTFG